MDEKTLREQAVAEVAAEKAAAEKKAAEEKNKLQQTAREMWASIKGEVLQDIRAEKQKPVDPYQAIVDKYNNRH